VAKANNIVLLFQFALKQLECWVPHFRKQESYRNEYFSERIFFNNLKPVIPVPFTGRIKNKTKFGFSHIKSHLHELGKNMGPHGFLH